MFIYIRIDYIFKNESYYYILTIASRFLKRDGTFGLSSIFKDFYDFTIANYMYIEY
jgi:hypothetical protein